MSPGLWVGLVGVLSLTWGVSWGSKLNVPRVLLPFSEEGTQFVLFAHENDDNDKRGCFKWKSSRPELVSITPVNEDPSRGCSSSAVVSSVSKSRSSKVQSVITAEDVQSPGHLLRCDVIVDTIHALQIVTKTHELYLEEAPEEFEVRAYDDQGNEFSTLEKIIFKWTIDNNVKKPGTMGDNIRFINFRDSTYAFEDTLMAIEAQNKQGRKVLLEGIKTGSSKVSVKLVSSLYSKVPPAMVNVMCVANLYLVPGNAYVMMGGYVNYHAEQIKSNKIHQIKLPTQQYFLTVANKDLVRLESESSSEVVGLALGSTEVYLNDHNVHPDDLVRPPTADIHVVVPAYITLSIHPYNNWNVLINNNYEITVEIFDSNNNRIYPSANIVMKVDIPQEYFKTQESSSNGTWHFGQPIKVGIADVSATLYGIKDRNGQLIELKTPLSTSAQLEIFDGILLDPALAVFPWDPVTRPSFEFQYVVQGAGSPFLWSSANQTVATVTQNGVVKTNPENVGGTEVKAAMNRASHNFGRARVLVIPTGGLKILNHVIEREIGLDLDVPLQFFAQYEGRRHVFTQCHKLVPVIGLTDERIFAKRSQQLAVMSNGDFKAKEACALIHLKAQSPGFSDLSVSYSYPGFDGQSVKLHDSVTIAAFKPLLPVQPFEGDALLAVESSLNIVWAGGPLPWIKKPESHFHKLSVQDESIVKAGPRILSAGAVSNTLFAFEVACLKLGETEVTLEVGNRKSPSLPQPVVVSSKIKVVCGQPESLELVAEVPLPEDTQSPCPLTARTGRVAALSYEDLKIRVTVLDAKGNKFLNISSLDMDWQLSDNSFGQLIKQPTDQDVSILGYKPIEDTYHVLKTQMKTGSLDLTANIKKSSSYLGFGGIANTLKVSLVKDASVTPNVKSVFNHPENREHVHVKDGSGFFEVDLSVPNVADAKFMPNNQTVSIRPLNTGDVTLTLRDLCLRSKQSPMVNVYVSGVSRVDLIMSDKVQQGNRVHAKIRLLDHHGEQISASALKYLTVVPTPASKIVELRPKDQPEDLLFTVKGLELGETTVTAIVKFGVQTVSSNPASIQVFPPLELEPRNITLLIGAKFQVRVVGGPNVGSDLRFALMDGEKTAKTNQNGLIEGMTLGSTRMIAKAVGVDKVTGEAVIYSEDRVDVHVVKFGGIRIHAPLTKIRVGGEMPVMAYGTDEHQNPYSHGSAIPYLDLTWDIGNQESADLVSVYHRNHLDLGKDNNGVMRFIARKPGRVTIKLNGKITKSIPLAGQFQFENDRPLSDTLEIQVVEDLDLKSPWLEENTLVMSTNSQYQLRTNRDSQGELRYSVLSKSNVGDAVSVSESGMVKAGRNIGTSVIFIEDMEDYGLVERMSIVVDVKPISYMMINVHEAFDVAPGEIIHKLPKGITLPLSVSYHDNTGLRFDATNAETSYRPSRFDTVSIRENWNNSLAVELVKEEYTVFRSFAGIKSRPDLQDFIIFNVERGVYPDMKQSVMIGDVIDLDNLVIGDAEDVNGGTWISEPYGKVQIDPQTGMATCLRAGLVKITYNIGRDQKISVDFVIKPASKINLDTGAQVIRSQDPQYVMFLVQSEFGNETSNFYGMERSGPSLVEESALFSCSAKFTSYDHKLNDYYKIRAVFHHGLRSHACEFTPKPSLLQSKTTLIDSNIEIRVVPEAEPSIRSAIGSFPFYPGFHLQHEELQLSNAEPSGVIAIQGLPDVLSKLKLEASNEQFLSLGRDYYEGQNVRMVPVYLRSAFWQEAKAGDWLSVSILTPQMEHSIPVRVIYAGSTCTNTELNWSSLVYFVLSHYQSLLFIVFSCIICILLTKILLKNNASSSTQSNAANQVKTATANSTSLKSPMLTSPSSPLNVSSSRSPYLWTVDNSSPIYGSPERRSPTSPRHLGQFSYSEQ